MLHVWDAPLARATKDLDLLGHLWSCRSMRPPPARSSAQRQFFPSRWPTPSRTRATKDAPDACAGSARALRTSEFCLACNSRQMRAFVHLICYAMLVDKL